MKYKPTLAGHVTKHCNHVVNSPDENNNNDKTMMAPIIEDGLYAAIEKNIAIWSLTMDELKKNQCQRLYPRRFQRD